MHLPCISSHVRSEFAQSPATHCRISLRVQSQGPPPRPRRCRSLRPHCTEHTIKKVACNCLHATSAFKAIFLYYLATLSSHFTIQNITAIEMKHTTANTLHVAAKEMLSYITAPRNNEKFPTAVAPSQHPCINPCK